MANLNRPAIRPGNVTEADLDALAFSKREPGPQASKASERAHRFADVFCITLAGIAIVAMLVHAWFSVGA